MKTQRRRLVSQAPVRIDLAGGTLDIWPIYLLLNSPLTINAGINLFARCELEWSPAATGDEGVIRLCSTDQKDEVSVRWSDLAGFSPPPFLDLHVRLLRYFARIYPQASHGRPDLSLRTLAKSPAGAGLGGSSALSVAIAGSLLAWCRGGRTEISPERDGWKLIDVIKDIESGVLRVPAGLQDYFGAMYGSLQALRWDVHEHHREAFSDTAFRAVQDRLLLFYSGQSRNSGINNWQLFKAFIDGDTTVRQKFSKILDATRNLHDALKAQDWVAAGSAIAAEWETRKTLAPEISTPEIDRAFETARQIAPDRAGKICGAGGGGCFFFYLPSADPILKRRMTEAVSALPGIRPLPFEMVSSGLEVHEEPI